MVEEFEKALAAFHNVIFQNMDPIDEARTALLPSYDALFEIYVVF